jgi:hypothetical protein
MTLSAGFAQSLLLRHPELHRVPARALEPERADGANAVALSAFFDTFEELHKRFNFHPKLVANFDETMIKFKETAHKVFAPREVTRAHFRMKPHVEHITLGATIFANGSHLKPLLIINKTYMPAEMVSLVTKEKWCVAGGDTAWITKAVFSQWVLGPFVAEINRKRQKLSTPNAPALLVVDGHSSRADADTMRRRRPRRRICCSHAPGVKGHTVEKKEKKVPTKKPKTTTDSARLAGRMLTRAARAYENLCHVEKLPAVGRNLGRNFQ